MKVLCSPLVSGKNPIFDRSMTEFRKLSYTKITNFPNTFISCFIYIYIYIFDERFVKIALSHLVFLDEGIRLQDYKINGGLISPRY